jgi:cytochrome c556
MKIQSAIAAIVLGGVLAAPAFAQTAAPNSQQNKMKACNAQAGDKKGDDRKAFMKQCLSSAGAAPAMTQQERMKACNVQAGDKKGDDRKAFMKQCLSTHS